MAGIRRTWDKAHYEALAKDRIARGDIEEEEREKEGGKTHRSKDEFQRADDNEAGPAGSERAYLRARESKVDIESKVGVIEVLKPNTAAHAAGPGWFCETCDCLLKDSASYLNHINGRKRKIPF